MASVVVHSGWLVKSPPLEATSTLVVLLARWRRRWFELERSGDLFFLHYYTDATRRKLKGTIALESCEQVDVGLTVKNGNNKRHKFDFVFGIRTPHRVYYLSASSDRDMHEWVSAVCQACQLKANDVDNNNEDDLGFVTTELCPSLLSSAPASSSSSSSSPYIHISTCYSGSRRLSEPDDDNVFHAPTRPPKPRHLQQNVFGTKGLSDYENASQMQRFTEDIRSLTLRAACTLPKGGFRPNAGRCSRPKNGPPCVQRQLKPNDSDHKSLQRLVSVDNSIESNGVSKKFESVTLPRHFASASTPNFRLRQLDNCNDDLDYNYGDTNASQHNQEEQIYFFMPSLGSLGGCASSLMIPAERYTRDAVAYTDVYVPEGPAPALPNVAKEISGNGDVLSMSSNTLKGDSAYKKIDFVKTDAFNRTRHKAEEKYNLQAESAQ